MCGLNLVYNIPEIFAEFQFSPHSLILSISLLKSLVFLCWRCSVSNLIGGTTCEPNVVATYDPQSSNIFPKSLSKLKNYHRTKYVALIIKGFSTFDLKRYCVFLRCTWLKVAACTLLAATWRQHYTSFSPINGIGWERL